jgi:hypothetical protein
MNKYNAEECLKGAAECTRQAEAVSDPELKLYLMKLALSWTRAAVGVTVSESSKTLDTFAARSLLRCKAHGTLRLSLSVRELSSRPAVLNYLMRQANPPD